MRDDFYKWIIPHYSNTGISENCLRYKVASKEAEKDCVRLEKIIEYVNEFLLMMGMETIKNPKIEYDNKQNFKERLKKMTVNLDDERDIVWMKFTADGYLGVVGTSNDINFDDVNTSGKIIRYLQKEWDDSFILMFPLIKSPQNPNILDRHLMESGIGNYLISKDVPILDFYSHNI